MTDEKRIGRLVEFLRARRYPAATDDELADDLEDYVRELRGSARGGRRGVEEARFADIKIPRSAEERGRDWLKARLRRLEWMAVASRRRLGFDSVPWPGEVELAEDFWNLINPPAIPERKRARRTIERTARLDQALLDVHPRPSGRNPKWNDEEFQFHIVKSALREVTGNVEQVAERLDDTPENAARWIFAGVEPRPTCLRASVSLGPYALDRITLEINPNVITPEEVSAIYRSARRSMKSTTRRTMETFFSFVFGNILEPLGEQFELWNERYPLRRYKNLESFRVASHSIRSDLIRRLKEEQAKHAE